ncbi:WS/DGAT/MGAT family O-acyltransferase [Tomitella biformata]|uniref:WS/DGAT/MGAT family O-acyltransferase n=1 Tax=Tomitella biformata TaxID=630403 RepID=UPI000466C044|nr:wax ester/triacylglycerol synthase family O-acyltransferase [Tomitella biformata]
MVTRLSGQDAAFFYVEDSATPAHLGSLAIFDAAGSRIGYDGLLALIEGRLSQVPRYRQRVKEIAGGLIRPVWVDDEDFDITYHVRRSALPSPGTQEQLNELVARLISRPLDRNRPLWELYVIEGLEGDRFAMFTKSHQAIVDAFGGAFDIGHVLLDTSPDEVEGHDELWMPSPEPGALALVINALSGMVSRPTDGIELVRYAVGDVASSISKVSKTVTELGSIARGLTASAPSSVLNAELSHSRRYVMASSDLQDYKRVRARYGGTINDAALSVLSGALRNWLISRGEAVSGSTMVRALVPMSVFPGDRQKPGAPPSVGVEGSGQDQYPLGPLYGGTTLDLALVDLPVGEQNPVVRLSQIAYSMSSQPSSSRAVAARNLTRMSGFAPPTMHAMGARLASSMSRRAFNLVITNAPGPQMPLYFAGAKMLEIHPVPPLVRNQALSIGLTSYDGRIFYGINADREAMSDLAMFPELIRESIEDLLETL